MPPSPSPAAPDSAAPGADTPGAEVIFDPERVEKTRRRLLSRPTFRAYTLAKLPLAAFAGLTVEELTLERCAVGLPYGWRSQNPFRSIYFAAQAMAAELSTGALALLATEAAPASVAMLIVDLDARFGKKASDRVVFTCDEGDIVTAAVRETLATGEGTTARVESVGRLPDGGEVARFHFTWSFKRRRPRP